MARGKKDIRSQINNVLSHMFVHYEYLYLHIKSFNNTIANVKKKKNYRLQITLHLLKFQIKNSPNKHDTSIFPAKTKKKSVSIYRKHHYEFMHITICNIRCN